MVDSNGHNLRRLTTNQRSHSPAWSPDGSKIAFLSEAHKAKDSKSILLSGLDFAQYLDYLEMPRELAVMDADGQNAKIISPVSKGARGVFWFPDGERLGVRALQLSARHVLTETPITDKKSTFKDETLKEYLSTEQPLGVCVGDYWCLREWIPPVDNFMPTMMAFAQPQYISEHETLDSVNAWSDATQHLHVFGLDGSKTDFPIRAYDLAWSADGKSVAYSTFSTNDYSVLYKAEVANGEPSGAPRALTNQALDAHGPAWSADGARIAFMGLWKNSSQIFGRAMDCGGVRLGGCA